MKQEDENKIDDDDFTRWCKMHFARMAMNGKWAVPRSLLIFQKTGEAELTLAYADAESPYEEHGNTTWRAYQIMDYRCIKGHFKAAGISVISRLEGFDGQAD